MIPSTQLHQSAAQESTQAIAFANDPAAHKRADHLILRGLRVVTYPLLLLAGVAIIIARARYDWSFGSGSMIFLFGTIAYLVVLERLIPYDVAWHPSSREWGLYGVYFLLTMIGGALAQFLVGVVISRIAPAHPAMPLWLEIPLALLLSSLASYAFHRLGHVNPWIWRLHGVHHVPAKVNVGNNGVNHVFDVMFAQFAAQVLLSLIGFSRESVFAVGIFIIAQGYFIHANIDVRIGWLNYILASPEQHRLHHSTELSEAGHYGSCLSIWDRLFGSYTWHPERRPREVGLQDPASFPRTGAVFSTLIHPWRRRRVNPLTTSASISCNS